jgi:hypothetical protein
MIRGHTSFTGGLLTLCAALAVSTATVNIRASGHSGIDDPAATIADEPAAAQPATPAAEDVAPVEKPTSVAVGDMVGGTINAEAWAKAVPMLETDKVDVVVVTINSGGGIELEVSRFNTIFQEQYKKRFRTVAWVESAIGAAAKSTWVLEEFYMMPQGNIGACTTVLPPFTTPKGEYLEKLLQDMVEVSKLAGRDPKIMRSMQILEPLSADIDPETGNVTWYQDATSGKHIVNASDRILTFNASNAVEYKFARAIAETKGELVAAMGIVEWEEAGKEATEFIQNHMKTAAQTEKRFFEVVQKYLIAVEDAQAAQDDEKRGAQVGRARKFLAEMRRGVKVNPNFVFHFDQMVGSLLDDEFFRQQEEMLDELAAGGRR